MILIQEMHEPLKIQNSHFLGILPQSYRGAKVSDITENLLYNSWFPESNIIFFNNVFIYSVAAVVLVVIIVCAYMRQALLKAF